MRTLTKIACVTMGVVVVAALAWPPPEPTVPEGQLQPKWRVGEQWVVETTARSAPTSDEQEAGPVRAVVWTFTVAKIEKVGEHACYRVEIKPDTDEGPQPLSIIWVDEKSLALRRIQTQLPVQEDLRTVIESYEFDGGQVSPVMGPLTGLPIDLPVFLTAKPRGGFSYRATAATPGARGTDGLAFAVSVEQQITAANPEKIKALLGGAASRDLKAKPIFEVQLKGPEGQVRQLWQAGLPWPAYSDNGHTEARLVKVVPPR